MIHLLTTLWKAKNEHRADELRRAFVKNLECKSLDCIHLFWESQEEPPEYTKHDKVCIVNLANRPKFGDYFAYANEKIQGKIIVANSDIWFDHTIEAVRETDFSDTIWCLTRHNDVGEGREMPQGLEQGVRNYYSQDVWVLQTPIKHFAGWDVIQGILGCDSHMAGVSGLAGFKVKNPCLSVICHHIHNIGERNDQIDGWSYWNDPNYSPRPVPWEHL